MQVQFSLKMKDALIEDNEIDYLQLDWQESLTPKELADYFNQWLSDQTFIERKLPELIDASYCQLFINPL